MYVIILCCDVLVDWGTETITRNDKQFVLHYVQFWYVVLGCCNESEGKLLMCMYVCRCTSCVAPTQILKSCLLHTVSVMMQLQ